MAERPRDNENGHDPVGSGQQDDRADERADAPAEHTADAGHAADEGITGIEERGRPGTGPPTEAVPGDAGANEPSNVLPFSPRGDADADDELIDFDDLDEDDADAIDLAELRADDALLDALGGTDPSVPESAGTGPSVETLLVSWRRDVDSAPIEDLVDVDTAVATITEARKPKRRPRRMHLVPVASAAAVLMIMFTGVGLAARDALPGDALWGVAQVLYSDRARAAEAHQDAKHDLELAQQALNKGNQGEAEGLLDSAQQHMQDVDHEHGLSTLKATHESLAAEVGGVVAPPESSSSTSPSEYPTGTSEHPTSTSESVPSETESSTPSTSDEESTDTTSIPSDETSGSSSHPSSDTSQGNSGSGIPTFSAP